MSCVAGVLSFLQAEYNPEYAPPVNYYSEVDGKLGEELKASLADIVAVFTFNSYDNITGFIRAVDTDPQNVDNLILIYSGFSAPKGSFGTSANSWNREHLWPQSYGADDEGSGQKTAHSDIHHLFPANVSVNSTRSNKYFDWTAAGGSQANNAPGSSYDADSYEPRDEDKGRVARAILYMDVRHDGRTASGDLKLSDRPNSGAKTMGKLSVLLEWNRLFPPDEREQRRNHLIYTGATWGVRTYKQGNRNPFVDYPELADAIYTADQYISRNSWLVQNFALADLRDATVTGDLANPDGDNLPNFAELAFNADPLTPTDPSEFFIVADSEAGRTVSYTRIKDAPARAFLSYQVEVSDNPYDSTTWETFASTETVTDDGLVETATLSAESGKYYRLAITSSAPGSGEATAYIEPEIGLSPLVSVFRYEHEVISFKVSAWLGFVYDRSAPWYWTFEHGWQFGVGENPAGLWLYDLSAGWVFTGADFFPFLYSADSLNWLLYVSGQTPSRTFYDFAVMAEVTESEL